MDLEERQISGTGRLAVTNANGWSGVSSWRLVSRWGVFCDGGWAVKMAPMSRGAGVRSRP